MRTHGCQKGKVRIKSEAANGRETESRTERESIRGRITLMINRCMRHHTSFSSVLLRTVANTYTQSQNVSNNYYFLLLPTCPKGFSLKSRCNLENSGINCFCMTRSSSICVVITTLKCSARLFQCFKRS